MEKISKQTALSFIDSFMEKIAVEKKAESVETVGVKETGGTPAGTTGPNGPTASKNTSREVAASAGAFGKEKSADVNAGVGVSIQSPSAKNTSTDVGIAGGTFNTADAGDGGRPSGEVIEAMKVASELNRAQGLAERILNKIAQQQAPVADYAFLAKQAADESYHNYVTSFQAGLAKKAEDRAAVMEATGMDEAQADQLLNEIAMENPEAVLPAEAQAAPEGDAEADQLVSDLIALGVPPEAIEAAAQEVDAEEAAALQGSVGENPEKIVSDLIALGVPPEAIAAASQEVDAEEKAAMDGGIGPSMDDANQLANDLIAQGVPPEAIAAASQEVDAEEAAALQGAPVADDTAAKIASEQDPMRKQALETFENIKDIVRAFRSGNLEKEAAIAAEQDPMRKQALETFDNIKEIVRAFRAGTLEKEAAIAAEQDPMRKQAIEAYEGVKEIIRDFRASRLG